MNKEVKVCNTFSLLTPPWPAPLVAYQIPFSVCIYLQVKILNKLASAKASGKGGGSKVLNDLVEGLEEPAFSAELRLKIDQNHADLKGG